VKLAAREGVETMSNARILLSLFVLIGVCFAGPARSVERASPIIIDHACTDISKIPQDYINAAKQDVKMYFGHTSHGWQLTCGLLGIEGIDTLYAVEITKGYMPYQPNALCMYDNDAISPDDFWRTAAGMNRTRGVLDQYPETNAAMFGWCVEISGYSEQDIAAYLDSMSVLEAEYPNVTFVYMTGNAQCTGICGLWRYENNNIIRQYCIDNNKVLFDFADLDAWWYDAAVRVWDLNNYEQSGVMVPAEHPEFYGNECGHTLVKSCEQKGKAVWWMMARLAGWSGQTPVEPFSWSEIKKRFKNPQ
jgi:hypothetical protein